VVVLWLGSAFSALALAPAAESGGGDELSAAELEELVGPVALYPDELLAVVLPASTFPVQVVQAARFLDKKQSDPSLEPSQSWDQSVLAIINYPEAVEKLNADLEWTERLGDAVLYQQDDVLDAVQQFRSRAQAAGNLESNKQQIVVVEKWW